MTALSDLQASIRSFSFRAGDEEYEGAIAQFIRLGEAHLNRELPLLFQETDAALTGTVGSRLLPLPADFVEPIALHLTTDGAHDELRPDVAGDMPLQSATGSPSAWAMTRAGIQLDAPCDRAHAFTFRYRARFALSDAQPTNWLVENHFDVYLAAALGWGAAFMRDDPELAKWKAVAQEAIDSIAWQASRSRLTTATVDVALMAGGRFSMATG